MLILWPGLRGDGAVKDLRLQQYRGFRSATLAAKSGMDILVACILLLILLPVFLIITIAIKLDSKGPVFFFYKQ